MPNPLLQSAGEQLTANTRNAGSLLTGLAMLVGIAHEYGLKAPAFMSEDLMKFLQDPRVVMIVTSAVLWASNSYRKSRLRHIIDHTLDHLEHEVTQ